MTWGIRTIASHAYAPRCPICQRYYAHAAKREGAMGTAVHPGMPNNCLARADQRSLVCVSCCQKFASRTNC
eukprot:5619194-Pyramimonas_sp.AAC.1